MRRYIDDIPSEWLELCLTAMALDPETADDNPQSAGMPVRPYLTETHRLMCGACRSEWHPIRPDDTDDRAWYGRCANCRSDQLTVESELVPNAPQTNEWYLCCSTCEATWVGLPGDACTWCIDALEHQRDHQAELLLTAPDCDPQDVNYENRMQAWSERMLIGVQAELITAQQSRVAWRRATGNGAA